MVVEFLFYNRFYDCYLFSVLLNGCYRGIYFTHALTHISDVTPYANIRIPWAQALVVNRIVHIFVDSILDSSLKFRKTQDSRNMYIYIINELLGIKFYVGSTGTFKVTVIIYSSNVVIKHHYFFATLKLLSVTGIVVSIISLCLHPTS